MIKRSEIQDLVSNYDNNNLNIGIFGSQSALEQGAAAKYAGLRTVVIVQKGRDATYVVHNKHLFDEFISVDNFKDALDGEIQKKLVETNTIMLPNRSMVAYWELDDIENNFLVPFYGSRELLRAEERSAPAPRNQYHLLESAGIRMPKLFSSPDDIDRPVVVKAQQKDNPLERGYFYPSSPEKYYHMRGDGIRAGIVSAEGVDKASIEEYVIGPYVNANFHVFALTDIFGEFDLLGFSDREQTNESGFRNLHAALQLELEGNFSRTNEEICHRGKTVRESKLEEIYNIGERFFQTLEKEIPPGIIGMIGLQGAFPIDENRRPCFTVFDVSFRIPGDPAMSATSPFLHSVGSITIKHKEILDTLRKPYGERKLNFPLDLTMMEIEVAAGKNLLTEIVT